MGERTQVASENTQLSGRVSRADHAKVRLGKPESQDSLNRSTAS